MYSEFETRKKTLIESIKNSKGNVSLQKDTSNLFRNRSRTASQKLDVRDFNHVLGVDVKKGFVDVEGMTPYDILVDETLKYGVMPTVVPELKSITIGGAITGGGIESSSFKYGFVHETAMELEIVTAEGEVVIATPTNKHKKLFYGFPNSYGTLGYVLRVRMKVVPVKSLVKIEHTRFSDSKEYFTALSKVCAQGRKGAFDFIDGTIFSKHEMYMTTGTFIDDAPFISNYSFKNIYYKSIQRKTVDYISVHDYIWRWDTDWFWCSKNLGAQNWFLRRFVFGKKRLNSRFYNTIRKKSQTNNVVKFLGKLFYTNTESVIQDVEIPLEHCEAFLSFFQKEIGITPIWICPAQQWKPAKFDLYVTDPHTLYMNFGFWDFVKSNKPKGYLNKKIEQKVLAYNGKKSLYSSSYFDEKTFWKSYNKKAYDTLKKTYDPKTKFLNLYQKCVLRK